MRKTLELLALSTCTAALCVTLTGCEAVKGTASGEKPVKTVYPLHSWSLLRTKARPGFLLQMFRWMICWLRSRAGRRVDHGCSEK